MTSLRNTVMVYVTVLLLAVGVAAAATSYFFVKREVNSFQDNALQEVALTAGLIFRHDIQPHIDAELEDQLVVQVWDLDEKPLHQSGPSVEIPYQKELGYSDVSAGGERWRVFRARDSQHAIQIAQRWSAREEVAAHAAAGAAVPLLAAIPLAWLLIGWAVKRVLLGLGKLSEDIGQRSAETREALSVAGVPREITPLVSAMNALIGRHQHALETQRRFVADAAHELRTPLAALQIQIDNLRARDLAEPIREMATDLLGGIRRAVYSVNQLLTMARADAAAESDPEEIDVARLTRFVAAGFTSIADAKGVRLSVELIDDLRVVSRASDIQLVLSNLLDNALRYTPAGGHVRISGSCAVGAVSIEIADDGPGIAEAALPFIYDRFFRAASQEVEGTGLGLAIAKTAADRNGACIVIANRSDRSGIRAILEMPTNTVSEPHIALEAS